MAAANNGNPSKAFKCAPRARTSELYVAWETWERRLSRCIRGRVLVAVHAGVDMAW